MAGLNWLDLIIIMLGIFSLGVGLVQGLLRQVIGLAALYIATILGTQYYTHLGNFIRGILFQPTSRFLNAISFFIIVVVVWLIITWLAYDTYRSTKIQIVPLLDQLGGSTLGLATLIFIVTLALPIAVFSVAEPWPGNEPLRMVILSGLETSRMVPIFESLKPTILNALLPWLPLGLPSIFNL